MEEVRPERSPRDYFYGEVLRLPPGTGNPDYYTLLGLPFFEEDHDAILRAALERTRLLEACQADRRTSYRRACEALLARVQRARMTLLDRKRRREYDAVLVGRKPGGEERPEEDDSEVELPTGTMLLGRYRILGEARRGGLGVVYDALDSNMRSRVHLSVLRPRLSKDKMLRRGVERAARDAAALDHPGILRLDEVGDADGLLFARSRAPEGKNLVELAEGTPRVRLPADQARPIVAAVAEALAHAHAQGVVHGALRPQNVLVDVSGRVLVADFCVARAVADASKEPSSSPYQAPEEELAPAGDLFSLGAVAYHALAGAPPFKVRGANQTVPPLPDDVPEDLEVLVMRLLAPDPAQRLGEAAEVARRLAASRSRRRLPALVATAAVLVVALLAALLGRGTQERTEAAPSLRGEAWRLIADRDYDAAIEKLRAEPVDPSTRPALARALTGKALLLEKGGDPCGAQLLLAEALALEDEPERALALARAKGAALARLAAIPVEVDAVAEEPHVRVRAGDVPVESVLVDGRPVEVREGVAELALGEAAEGPRAVAFTLADRAGNAFEGSVSTVVDRTPPRIAIVEPEDGALLRDGSIRVRVRVLDANPPAHVTVRGRRVALRDGEAEDRFDLGDGRHVFDAEVADLAGHAARAELAVVVDSKAPDLVLDAKRVAIAAGPATVRGRLGTEGARLEIDGEPVQLAADGSFARPVEVRADRLVVVEAVGPTGIRKKLSLQVVVDAEPPQVAVAWERRAPDGRLLYGGREMEAGALALPLRVEDRTDVRFEPAEGEVRDGHWILAPHEGAREVALAAVDEAGNRSELVLQVDGHRSTPALAVRSATKDRTADEEAVLEVETDADLLVQGQAAEPGRVRVALPEGEVTLLVQAVDFYGNETRWSRTVRVDRTPPAIRLVGEPERGVGRQEIVFEADEPLASVTCAGRTVDVNAATARVPAELQPGRRSLHVVARDLAGNVTKEKFAITVHDRALELDGASAFLVNLPPPGETFTVECWVRGFELPRGAVILSCARSCDYTLAWTNDDKAPPYATLALGRGGILTLPAKKAWKWEDWTHLALCSDGKKARFYVDGSLHAAIDVGEPLRHGAEGLLVGAAPGGSFGKPVAFFRGAIDELRVSDVARYPRAFSPPRFHKEDENTLLLLRFDVPGEGGHLVDTSGKGRTVVTIGHVPKLVESGR